MPKISVLMGAFNCSDTLGKSIESIIHQSFKDWELIICDDGSSDDTWLVMNQYAAMDSRIKLIRNVSNKKLAYTLNHCLRFASGEYCARMDGDDVCDVDRFKIQHDFLEKNPEYGFVSSEMKRFDENGIYDDGLGHSDRSPSLLDYVKGSPFCHAPVMIRKEAYELVGGYRDYIFTQGVEDYDLWLRLLAVNIKGYILGQPLYSMYDGREASGRRTWKRRYNEFKVRLYGYKLLDIPYLWRLYSLKPLIIGLIPNCLYDAMRSFLLKNK